MKKPEASHISASACAAIDRNRNERQKMVLLTYASRLICGQLEVGRQNLASVRAERTQLSCELQDTRAHLISDSDLQRREIRIEEEKKAGKSIRTIPKA